MNRFAAVLGWIISLPCLLFSAWMIFVVATVPGDRMGSTIIAVILPFFLSLGVAINPLVFIRLPFARSVWMRFVAAAAIVTAATLAGWWFSQAIVLEHYRSLPSQAH